MSNGAPPGRGYKFATWALVIVVLLLGIWQYCTWRYLRDDLSAWLKDHGGDGQYPPPPPPKF